MNADSASVSDCRSWQVRDTKELTVLITMRHYGHGAVWLCINGPRFSSAIGPTVCATFFSFTSTSHRASENSRLISDFQVNSQNWNDQGSGRKAALLDLEGAALQMGGGENNRLFKTVETSNEWLLETQTEGESRAGEGVSQQLVCFALICSPPHLPTHLQLYLSE